MNKEEKEKLVSIIHKLLHSMEELHSGNYYNLPSEVIREIAGWYDYYRAKGILFDMLLANEEIFDLYGFKVKKHDAYNFDLIYNGKLVLI